MPITARINGQEVYFANMNTLVERLEGHPPIAELHLAGNQIGDAEATTLAEALRMNQTITTLDLSGNQIGTAGTTALAEALKVNKTLTALYLWENQIGDAEAATLAEALKMNKTLTILRLSENRIEADGAAALAEALRVNVALRELDLSHNHIGNTGAAVFAEALRMNGAIINLGLWENRIGANENEALAEALTINSRANALATRLIRPTHSPTETTLTPDDLKFLSDPSHPENSLKVLDSIFREIKKLESTGELALSQKENFYNNSHDFDLLTRIAAANLTKIDKRNVARTDAEGDERAAGRPAPERHAPRLRRNKSGRHFEMPITIERENDLLSRVSGMLSSEVKSKENHCEITDRTERGLEKFLAESRRSWREKMAATADRAAAAAGGGYGGGRGGSGEGGGGGAGSGEGGSAAGEKREKPSGEKPSGDVAPTDTRSMLPPRKRFRHNKGGGGGGSGGGDEGDR